MARPSKCTDTLTEHIAAHVRMSGSISLAAVLCGVDGSTACRWFRDGKKNKTYRQFHQAIKKALAEWEQSRIANITKAEQEGTWQAAAWLLERNPHTRERYRRPTQKSDAKISGAVRLQDLWNNESRDAPE